MASLCSPLHDFFQRVTFRGAAPPAQAPNKEEPFAVVLQYARTFAHMGRRRWQRRRSSHPVRRPHKRGSAARRDARQRQHASDGRPPPRPQRHGKRTKPRGLPKRVRQPARLSCPFAPGADLDAISLSDAPDRTEVGPARGRSFPKNKLASVGHEREQLFQRWWASHVLHLARKSPCFAMRSAFVIATPSNGGRPLPLLLLTSISRSTIFVTYPRPQFPVRESKTSRPTLELADWTSDVPPRVLRVVRLRGSSRLAKRGGQGRGHDQSPKASAQCCAAQRA